MIQPRLEKAIQVSVRMNNRTFTIFSVSYNFCWSEECYSNDDNSNTQFGHYYKSLTLDETSVPLQTISLYVESAVVVTVCFLFCKTMPCKLVKMFVVLHDISLNYRSSGPLKLLLNTTVMLHCKILFNTDIINNPSQHNLSQIHRRPILSIAL